MIAILGFLVVALVGLTGYAIFSMNRRLKDTQKALQTAAALQGFAAGQLDLLARTTVDPDTRLLAERAVALINKAREKADLAEISALNERY